MKSTHRFSGMMPGTGIEDLSHAQAVLQAAKDVVDNNAPINEAEGDHEQAQLERDTSASIAEAQQILVNNGESQADGTVATEQPGQPSSAETPAVSTEGDEGDHEFRGDYHSDNQPGAQEPITELQPETDTGAQAEIPAVEVAPETPVDEPRQPKVFLGGTINGSNWRESLIPQLEIDHFNPVVEIWTMESQQMEEDAKINSDYNLFVITPKQSGFFSIAELTASAIRSPEKTLLAVLKEDESDVFDAAQLKSMDAVAELIKGTGATVFDNLGSVAEFLNSKKLAVAQESHNLSDAAFDVLGQLHEKRDGVEDGDLVSKEGRDQLVELGLCSRTEEGMNIITVAGVKHGDDILH